MMESRPGGKIVSTMEWNEMEWRGMREVVKRLKNAMIKLQKDN